MADDKSASILNSLLGPGSTFMGHLEMEGLVKIDGFFAGSLRTTGTVVISRHARCEGPIRAKVVVVGGFVKGSVYAAERADLLPGAVIVGNVFAPRLRTERDAVIHGDCRILGAIENTEAAIAAFIESHGGFPDSIRKFLTDPKRRRDEDERRWTR